MLFTNGDAVPIPNKDILSWIFDDPKYDQDKPIYIDAKNPTKSISSRQARVIVRKLAAGFRAAGLVKGDCVCVSSFNDIQYSMVFLGIIAAGGIFSGVNPSYTQYELCHHIETSRSRFLITEPEMLSKVVDAAKQCKIPHANILIFDLNQQPIPRGFKSWRKLMEHGEEDWVRFDDEKTAKETTAARLFSSGTTGLPKAANLSHHNFIAQHTLVHEIDKKPYEASALLCLPMFHAACVPVAHTTPLRSGSQAYVMRRFELEPYLANVQKYKIAGLRVVPPIIIAIIMSPLRHKYSLASVKLVSSGAAPLGKDAQRRLKELMDPKAPCTQAWGMTETSCIATKLYYPEGDDTGSVGRLLPGLEAKIIDDDGNNISAYNVRGEICIRGPTIVDSYYENPAANVESFDSEGFYKTGDIAYCDGKTKKWYIVDRKKELIKVRGFQIAPPEVEAVLLSHPEIVDAAVIGVKHVSEPDIEQPRAYVVRRPGPGGLSLNEKAVKDYCGTKLAKYKELTGGVVFLEAIPKNASGKILKRVLRETAKTEVAGGKAKL